MTYKENPLNKYGGMYGGMNGWTDGWTGSSKCPPPTPLEEVKNSNFIRLLRLIMWDDQLGQQFILAIKCHDDVIEWKHFPRYWPFVQGIHQSPVKSPHKGQWCGALMFSLICALNKRLSKQSWGWWFDTPSRSLWRHCNVMPSSSQPSHGLMSSRIVHQLNIEQYIGKAMS